MAYVENVASIVVDAAAIERVPEIVARENSVLAVEVTPDGLRVIVPADRWIEETVDKLTFVLGVPLVVDTADRENIDASLTFHYSAMNAKIDNCRPQFRFRCPKQWIDLSRTANRNVRFCSECQQDVYFCQSDAELERRARKGQCVAVASALDEPGVLGMIDFDADCE